MDLERKLKILADCDFSEWRKWQRAKDLRNPPSSIHGFGNALHGIFSAPSNIAESGGKERMVEIIYLGYGNVTLDYSRIHFEEMDIQDEDFKFLFEYNQLLKKLGSKLVKFIDRCHAEKFQCSKDWLEFKELMDLRGEFIQRDYREQVLDKYGIKYPDSVTNAADIKN